MCVKEIILFIWDSWVIIKNIESILFRYFLYG